MNTGVLAKIATELSFFMQIIIGRWLHMPHIYLYIHALLHVHLRFPSIIICYLFLFFFFFLVFHFFLFLEGIGVFMSLIILTCIFLLLEYLLANVNIHHFRYDVYIYIIRSHINSNFGFTNTRQSTAYICKMTYCLLQWIYSYTNNMKHWWGTNTPKIVVLLLTSWSRPQK